MWEHGMLIGDTIQDAEQSDRRLATLKSNVVVADIWQRAYLRPPSAVVGKPGPAYLALAWRWSNISSSRCAGRIIGGQLASTVLCDETDIAQRDSAHDARQFLLLAVSMKLGLEYKDLKDSMMDTTRKSGGIMAAYFLVTVDGQAALSVLIGMAFGMLYLLALFRDIDNVKGTDEVPMIKAMRVESLLGRNLAKWAASYYHALKPRLLIPVALAAGMAAYAQATGEPLSNVYEGGLLLGFLSYKGSLISMVAEDLLPKSATEPSSRPTIEKLEDNLDRWGRPKAQMRMPTDALPEDVDTTDMGPLPNTLARELLRDEEELNDNVDARSVRNPNLICIGATDQYDNRAYFSNYGAKTVYLRDEEELNGNVDARSVRK
eukprot:gene6596-3253_t